mgnify:FL=1
MENRKVKPLKELLVISLILIILAIGLLFIQKNILNIKYEEMRTQINSTAELSRKISSVDAETLSYQSTLQKAGKVFSNLQQKKEEYTSYLGETTMANRLNINKMTVDDVQPHSDGLYTMTVSLEVQGDLYNIKNFVQQLYDSSIVNRINSFSYRLQSERYLQWMWRAVDDEQLVSWWDLTAEEETTGQEEALTAEEMMKQGTALCYVELEFIGVGG